MAIGLGIESSDLDLAIFGLQIKSRIEQICTLQTLESAFQGIDYVITTKSILTAIVPVLKLVI